VPSPLACTVGHTAIFAVNAALVASQWQLELTNAEHEAGQAASIVFQVFGILCDRESNQSYQLWWRVLNQLHHLILVVSFKTLAKTFQ